MKRTIVLAAGLLCIFALASCGSAPDIRYYRLDYDESGVARASQSSDIVLSVEALVGDAAYEDPRMVYRTSPYRLDYYYYHRWTSPPGVLVSDYLRGAYERTGYFRTVVAGFSPEAPVFLGGRVAAFEEIDLERNEWIARVKLDLYLRASESGNIVWSRTIVEDEKLDDLSPEGLAAAMSRALSRIVSETAPEFVEVARDINERRQRAKKRSRALEAVTPDDTSR